MNDYSALYKKKSTKTISVNGNDVEIEFNQLGLDEMATMDFEPDENDLAKNINSMATIIHKSTSIPVEEVKKFSLPAIFAILEAILEDNNFDAMKKFAGNDKKQDMKEWLAAKKAQATK